MQASFAAVDRVSSVIGARQDEVRVASNGSSGVSTGEAEQGRGFWIQGFGFKGDQDKRGGIDGYSASTGGFAFGGDALVGNGDFRVGAVVSYASTGVDGEGANASNRTDIDSYQGTLYGSWNTGTWYVDAALGYARHTYDTKRLVTVGLVTDTVTGSHDGNQYLAKIGGGYPIQWGKVIFTPLASATYVHLDQDGYTETGTAGAALVVNDTQTDSFRTGLGAKVKLPLSDGSYKTAVEARAIWNHEFGDNSQDITARFAAGGSSFTTNGVSLARDSANLGLGLNMTSVNGQTLSVNYDADVKSDYTGHTASVQFRYDF
jgi:outer membrane autotransporter protein